MTTEQTSTSTPRPPETVLVIGATGRTGRQVVAGLLDHDVRVRALVRDPLTAGLPEPVETVTGDLGDPVAVAGAADGADAAFLLWPRFSSDGASEVVSALAERVDHIVYLSATALDGDGETTDGPNPGVWADLESLIEQAPVTHVFVRGGGFAGNTLAWADQIRRGDTVRLPFPEAGRSLVDERDLAAVAVRGLLDPELHGATPSVTGPVTLTQAEQVQLIGEALGRHLTVEEQPVAEARREYVATMGAEYADTALGYWATLVDRPEPSRDDVARLLGRPARTFAEWAELHRADFERLTTAEVARRYADGFRTGDVRAATGLLANGVVRVAPLETDGEPVEVRGLPAIMAHVAAHDADIEIDAVEVGEPMIGSDRFAIRFSFDETVRATGEPRTTTKLSLCTVVAGRISREEVYYFTSPSPVSRREAAA